MDAAEWEHETWIGEGDVDEHGDVVPVEVWRTYTDALTMHSSSRVSPSSAAAAHLARTGHALALGCCLEL